MLYATDMAGNTGTSSTISFTAAPEPEVFSPTLAFAVSVVFIVIIIGVSAYFKKKRREENAVGLDRHGTTDIT